MAPIDPAWFVLRSGPGDPAHNMALDEALLEAMPRLQKPVLRFYGWTLPAASFGYFQKYADVERATLLRPLVRRPTGGGVVPHDADWTYSLMFPAGHPWHALKAIDSYCRVHQWIHAAFATLKVPTELASNARKAEPGQCFVGHEKSDVLWHGKKIAGAAQRRTRTGLLIQGSVQPPPVELARAAWETALQDAIRADQQSEWMAWDVDDLVRERAETFVREKYGEVRYNQKR